MHNHTPSKYQNTILQCLEFFFSPIELFRYYTDGADVCSQCYTPIAVPLFYNSSVSTLIYYLGGILITSVSSCFDILKIPVLKLPVLLLLIILFHHTYTSIIFAHAPWLPYEPSLKRNLACKEEAKNGLMKKSIALSLGATSGAVLHFMFSSL